MDPINQHNEDTQANRLIKLGMRLGVSAALHPFEYAKVLIQVNTHIEIWVTICTMSLKLRCE